MAAPIIHLMDRIQTLLLNNRITIFKHASDINTYGFA